MSCSSVYRTTVKTAFLSIWVYCPVWPQFNISFAFIYSSHKKKDKKDEQNEKVLNWLSAWVCSKNVLKIWANLSLNVPIKKGSYKRKKRI